MPDPTPTSDPSKPSTDLFGSVYWKLYEKVGLPTFLLCLVIVAGWRFVEWAEPRVDSVVDKHLQFVETSSKTQAESLEIQKQNRDIHKEQAGILQQVIKSQDGVSIITDEHRRLTLEIRDDVKDIKASVMPRGTAKP